MKINKFQSNPKIGMVSVVLTFLAKTDMIEFVRSGDDTGLVEANEKRQAVVLSVETYRRSHNGAWSLWKHTMPLRRD